MSAHRHNMTTPASLFSESDRRFGEAVRVMTASNPFLPARIAAERAALGSEFEEGGADWNTRPPTSDLGRNHALLIRRSEVVIDRARAVWPKNGRVSRDDVAMYEAMTGYWLYQTYSARFDAFILDAFEGRGGE